MDFIFSLLSSTLKFLQVLLKLVAVFFKSVVSVQEQYQKKEIKDDYL